MVCFKSFGFWLAFWLGRRPDFHPFHSIHGSSVRFGTPYQAALLMNGSVYFGHLQDYGTSHPFLTEVFYVGSQTDTETKHVKSSLIKRGKEMREPRPHVSQPEPDCLCGDGRLKLKRCSAYCPSIATNFGLANLKRPPLPWRDARRVRIVLHENELKGGGPSARSVFMERYVYVEDSHHPRARSKSHRSAVRTNFEAVSSMLPDWDGPFH